MYSVPLRKKLHDVHEHILKLKAAVANEHKDSPQTTNKSVAYDDLMFALNELLDSLEDCISLASAYYNHN